MRKMIAAAAMVVCVGSAVAFEPSVAGIKPGMSTEEATAVLEKLYPGGKTKQVHYAWNDGSQANASEVVYKPNPKSPDFISVRFASITGKVMGIERVLNSRVSRAELVAMLEQKFGKPTSQASTPPPNLYMDWRLEQNGNPLKGLYLCPGSSSYTCSVDVRATGQGDDSDMVTLKKYTIVLTDNKVDYEGAVAYTRAEKERMEATGQKNLKNADKVKL